MPLSLTLPTAVARDLVAWLDITDDSSSAWWWTWREFQVQYYDMPRKTGERIESPATLGRKCWAFAYLAQIWPPLQPSLRIAMSRADMNLDSFIHAFEGAILQTMPLCGEVMANCFVNQTYDPTTRNGTCPGPIGGISFIPVSTTMF